MRTILFVAGIALSVATLQVAADERTPADAKAAAQLAGTYTIVAGEREGQTETPEHIRGTAVRFTDDTVTVTDKNKKETYVASYRLDSTSKPWHIAMTEKVGPSKGEKARGLIERRGDLVKLIYTLPGGDMPTDFEKTKNKQLMFVLKRNEK